MFGISQKNDRGYRAALAVTQGSVLPKRGLPRFDNPPHFYLLPCAHGQPLTSN